MADTATMTAVPAGAAEADEPGRRPVVTLLPGGHRRAETGHPWIYSNEIAMDAAAKALPAGALVTVRRSDERPLGVAMFNPHTLLAARLLDRDAARPIGKRFLCGISNELCVCASASTARPITGLSMPRRMGSRAWSSTGSARCSSCRPTPPASTG